MAKLLVQFQGQKKAFEKAKEATLTKKAEFDKFDLEDRQVTEKIQGIKKEGKKAKKALKRVTFFQNETSLFLQGEKVNCRTHGIFYVLLSLEDFIKLIIGLFRKPFSRW